MSRRAKAENIIAMAKAILEEVRPMTLRGLYYQLVSRQVIENCIGSYKSLSKTIVAARKEGIIPWDSIEDRRRRPRSVSMWHGLSDFSAVADQYRRDVWETQPTYLECWLEKDALSGFFEDVLEPFGVTLNVGIGYDGWDSIRNAADRLSNGDTVLYWGDFDPSGEDMVRSLRERLSFFGSNPQIINCALTAEDIQRYHLPPNPTKTTDSRASAFIDKHGDVAVELDAVPIDALRARLTQEVEARMDLEALAAVRSVERGERELLSAAFVSLGGEDQ